MKKLTFLLEVKMIQGTSKCDLLIILKPAMCDTTCEIPYCTQGKLITVVEIVHQSSRRHENFPSSLSLGILVVKLSHP